ncbi:Tetratricopeptide-like helical domain superfamily, partial [Sesbania bispinosa]
MADEAKAKGNAAFSGGDFTAAIRHFSDAIALTPSNHVLYSNRSAAYASLQKYAEALDDAKKTIELKPDWSKGYSRLGAAHLGLGHAHDAVSAYRKGLEIDPNNEALKSGLADAQAAASRSASNSPFGDAFSGPEMWARLTADPSTRAYLQQPDFVKIMQDIQKDPNKLNLHLSDQRVLKALGVVLNEEKEAKEKKALAQKEKEAGNAAYKKKNFETAIQHYSKALELDDEDISYLTNRAAVYLEMGKLEECIKDCDKAVERGRELRSDYKMIARALTRKGTALVKMAKCSKDFDPAIESFQKALTEHRNPDTLKKLNEAERAKKELEQQEYFDPKLADEEREKGNEFFKQQKYPEAVRHYTEAIKRNPKDHKAYSNRAACYTKLGAMPEALETYKEGLKHDPNNQELLDGIKRCVEQINKASRGDLSPEELKERQAKAMQDPEIQNILQDPVMRQ